MSAGLARGEIFVDWIREMVVGPNFVVKSYPRFCTRGYAFTTQKRRRSSTTYDAGVCSASGDDVYYGHIHEILEIKYSEEHLIYPLSSEKPRNIPTEFRGTLDILVRSMG